MSIGVTHSKCTQFKERMMVLVILIIVFVLYLFWYFVLSSDNSKKHNNVSENAIIIDHWIQKTWSATTPSKAGSGMRRDIEFVTEFQCGTNKISLICDAHVYSMEIGTAGTLCFEDNKVISFIEL